jgi:phosphoglycolate phosphatase
LLALERLNVHSTHAITIGDAKEDIEAGKRAKTKTIGVTYGSSGENIRESNPNYTVDSIAEIVPIILSSNS